MTTEQMSVRIVLPIASVMDGLREAMQCLHIEPGHISLDRIENLGAEVAGRNGRPGRILAAV